MGTVDHSCSAPSTVEQSFSLPHCLSRLWPAPLCAADQTLDLDVADTVLISKLPPALEMSTELASNNSLRNILFLSAPSGAPSAGPCDSASLLQQLLEHQSPGHVCPSRYVAKRIVCLTCQFRTRINWHGRAPTCTPSSQLAPPGPLPLRTKRQPR